jgi:acetylornithine deacetylase
LTESEHRVIDEIAHRRDELIGLTTDLIGFDTTTRMYDSEPARDEAALQEYLAARLRNAGAVTDVWEPSPEDVAGSPMIPNGLRFDGRPQMAARFAGGGEGRALLLNGHIDVVTVEPRDRWTSDPFRAEVRDGNLYGRGACDMKGGIAAMVLAAETLASLGHRLNGDLIICTVTDEESTGAGGLAAVAHGVRADAGIVTEPTALEVHVACRGSLIPTITVTGRPGHAGLPQQHWQQGGAVNAIDKATIVIDVMRRLEADWRQRTHDHHPHLSPGDIVPVEISGGEWIVSIPAECRLVYHIAYQPGQADSNGWGNLVRQEVSEWVDRACAGDDWLAATPPSIDWAPEVPAADVPADNPIVPILLASARAIGRPSRVSGANFWHDGATFTLSGTPSIAFGPGDGATTVHIIDEYVPIAHCVAAAQSLALAAMRYCGSS